MVAAVAARPTPALAPARAPRPHRDDARLIAVADLSVHPVADLPRLFDPGDLLVVNDAATWPASLVAVTPSRAPVEVRLTAGPAPGARVRAVLLGDGDWRTPTERRPPPPAVAPGDVLTAGEARLRVTEVVTSRLVELEVADDDAGYRALLAAGRPVQYAHVDRALADWDVHTVYAGRPWAAEMPSAGRPLSWQILTALRSRGVAVVPLTHAAGLSSTGDPTLDATLPWRERYEIPRATARAVVRARRRGRRVVAVGTTVVRALETLAATGARSGHTELVLGAGSRPRLVGAVLSGLHDPTDSHFRLLEAFAPRDRLRAAWQAAIEAELQGHELGDLMLVS
jgi:S-adenosylmethionine:tRNA ribosyltransferase-isomerase